MSRREGTPPRVLKQSLSRGRSKTVVVERRRRARPADTKPVPKGGLATQFSPPPPKQNEKQMSAPEQSRQRAPGKAAPERAPRRTVSGRVAPGRVAPGRTAPGRTAPGRAAPGRAAPGRVPGRVPGRAPGGVRAEPPRAPAERPEVRRAKRRLVPAKSRLHPEPRRRLNLDKVLQDDVHTHSLAALRRRRTREKEKPHTVSREVVVPEGLTVQELAGRMAVQVSDLLKLLLKQGITAHINQALDGDTAQLLAEELGHTVRRVSEADVEVGLEGEKDPAESLKARPLVVCVLGHVDHGKTSLLDALRKSRVAASEKGGITQHVGAYQVSVGGQKITFLDTPGHETFTALRARGAALTDLAVLVVAADEGVQPQTVEAINHARAANTPLLVALNKMDSSEANPQKVIQELARVDVLCEALGGDVQCVEVSARTTQGLKKLLEAILLQGEMMDLKANPARPADGVVIEARLDKGLGPVAWILVRRGTVKQGDVFVVGACHGRVRTLRGDHGMCRSASPSQPVEISGLDRVPEAGDKFVVVDSEERAKAVAAYRRRPSRSPPQQLNKNPDRDFEGLLQSSKNKELLFILKADTRGSAEALTEALGRLDTSEQKIRLLHTGVGDVNEADVSLAHASGARILGFGVRAPSRVPQNAVQMSFYTLVYELLDAVQALLTQGMSPAEQQKILGRGEVLEVFVIKKRLIAGCRIEEGSFRHPAHARILRNNTLLHEGPVVSLRRFKEDVAQVVAGQECGVGIDKAPPLEPGDIVECFALG